MLKITAGTKRFILHIIFAIDRHLFTFKNEPASDLAPIRYCFLAAFANGFELFDAMGQQQESYAAFETV